MDPNLFHVDWDRVTEMLVAVVILAVLVERALSVVFESRLYINSSLDKSGVKELAAVAVSFAVCRYWDFDAVSAVLLTDRTHLGGHCITAGVIAGGSKGSMKLFRDVMGIKSAAYAESEGSKPAKQAAQRAAGQDPVAVPKPAPASSAAGPS